MHIPGLVELTEREDIPRSMILLIGNTNVGKSCYCKELMLERLGNYSGCVYITCTSTEEQLQKWLESVDVGRSERLSKLHFINPYLRRQNGEANAELPKILREVKEAYAADRNRTVQDTSSQDRIVPYETEKQSFALIVDSLNHLTALFGQKDVEAFITDLYFTSKMQDLSGIYALTVPSLGDEEIERIKQSSDVILEMGFKDMDSGSRVMRVISIKGITFTPKWVDFELSPLGRIGFLRKESEFKCYVCKSIINENPVEFSGLYFHSNHLEVYKRLVGIYGLNLSELGFSSEVMDANFFFIDIVGLSDPSYSVSSQRQKIEVLNNAIMSCSAYNVEEKKIILPTGDGMVIGFMLNPENPLKLSMQLHQKLRTYNRGKGERDKIKVRIGLNSGPVFSVNDIKNDQNFWGPGIIQARRVMDIGGEGHILLSESLAKALLSLKDEYKPVIKPIGDYTIKHGQTLNLYSAYSDDFGNARAPERR